MMLATVMTFAQRQMERLDRGLVAMPVTGGGIFLSWRVFANEYANTGYNLYKGNTKIATISSTEPSNYTDKTGNRANNYRIAAVVNGVEQPLSSSIMPWSAFYKTIQLSRPTTGPLGGSYVPGDCSAGDLDGDGKYELIVKWQPANSKDNAEDGYTDNTYLDAYTLEGVQLWRIDLGKNIRSGSHYTQFMVYDLDGDGIAEIACKTAPGTKDGLGSFLSTGPASNDNDATDYHTITSGSRYGRILSGPEYLTVFNGNTGAEITTINYTPSRGIVTTWGDEYGNRVDRFLACVAYLDGIHPSLVMCRGYYARTALTAYDFRDSKLTQRWAFDTYGNTALSGYEGQGYHNLCVADVDNDGFDEIIYGSCCIDHDGKGKYTTGLRHGDAVHCGDFDPDRPGYEVWACHEETGTNGGKVATFRDAKTGQVLYSLPGNWDEGRALVADIDSTSKGAECWTYSTTNLWASTGSKLTNASPAKSPSFACWWDGDDLREVLTGTTCDNGYHKRVITFNDYAGATSANGTKETPNLQADLFGDWREELVFHSSDSTKLIVFTTFTPTKRRLFTLMHDNIYRLGIAWQNVAYNQGPDVSFYLGYGMTSPSGPDTYYAAKLNQIIALPAIGSKKLGDADFSPGATSTSNYPVSYISSDTTVARVINNKIHIVGAGSCNITAYQAGDSIYNEAYSNTQVFTVSLTALASVYSLNATIYPNPVADKLHVNIAENDVNATSCLVFDQLGSLLKSALNNIGDEFTIDVSDLSKGMYFIRIFSGLNLRTFSFVKK